ncbi:Competence protein [Enhygromyxa salina]|uniref:Competence protein n=1 Tax=Enhygromyxa salina TaxID=215803 RepID=A0A0C2CR79_9BACT|nr:helix-hairpin-helix domain-containing protein [Enhygromyxa salina]KIG13676.1 Competence protein [Enhygromyxa salina]
MNKTIRNITTSFALVLATLVGGSALAAAPTAVELVEQTEQLQQVDQVQLDANDADRFDAAVTLEGQVNINTASAAELELLPGIGPSIAARIISYRETHKYQQRNNIMRIRGIGQKTFAKIKDYLIVEGETTLRVAG